MSSGGRRPPLEAPLSLEGAAPAASFACRASFSAAKAAILGFTKALARELGTTGVTVNAITPGAVDTNIRVGSTEEQEAAINAGIPLGRNATTEEVAAVIAFLSSEDSAYLTGTTIDINGGSHIH